MLSFAIMSSITVNEVELRLSLEKHRDDIGHRYGIADAFAGMVFAGQSLFASYFDLADIPGVVWKYAFVTLGMVFAVRGVWIARGKSFSHEMLLKEIIDMNEVTHPFSIVAIKDSYNDYPNRFLLYYDERWSCWFFPNYKTIPDDSSNASNICEHLSAQLKLPVDSIRLELKGEAVHRKYSVSDDKQKVYDHKFYSASIDSFLDTERCDQFSIDGIEYIWMSIADMEKNPVIQERNSDIVGYIKAYI